MGEGKIPVTLSRLFKRLSNPRVRDVIELIRRRGHTLSGISGRLGIQATLACMYMKDLRQLGIVEKRTVKGKAQFYLRRRGVLRLMRAGQLAADELSAGAPAVKRPKERPAPPQPIPFSS